MKSRYKKINQHIDDRARRLCDMFPEQTGQTNISYIPPHRIVAFHMHQKQVDYWHCVKGIVRAGIITPEWQNESHYLSEHNQKTLEIPELHWHGYQTFEDPAILVYWVTNKYRLK